MMNFEDYIYSKLLGKKFHFKCDCTFPIDMIGVVKSYKIYPATDVIFTIERDDGKLVRITMKHPNLQIEEIAS